MADKEQEEVINQLTGLMSRFQSLQDTLTTRVNDYEKSYYTLAESFKKMTEERDAAVAELKELKRKYGIEDT